MAPAGGSAGRKVFDGVLRAACRTVAESRQSLARGAQVPAGGGCSVSYSTAAATPYQALRERVAEHGASALRASGEWGALPAVARAAAREKIREIAMMRPQLPPSLRYEMGASRTALINAFAGYANQGGSGSVMALGLPFVAGLLGLSQPADCYSAEGLKNKRRSKALAARDRPASALWYGVQVVGEGAMAVARAINLALLLLPMIVTAPVALMYGVHRKEWLRLFRWTLEMAGPAFIKWGQWAASRNDLFPRDMTKELSKLHCDAPAHDWEFTRRSVEGSFKCKINDIFTWMEEAPVASGSIAQIHKAALNAEGARQAGLPEGTVVAVKVRHPGVGKIIARDFALMRTVAQVCNAVPFLRWMRLEESIKPFATPLFEQLDLSMEADNLFRFHENFATMKSVTFPMPVAPFVAERVLVESWEEGTQITEYLHGDHHFNPSVARLGCMTLLKMMMKDNFIHADLHPGNVLVRLESPANIPSRLWHMVLNGELNPQLPRIVLLDVGMTAELSDEDKVNVVEFFKGVVVMDGKKVAESVLKFTNDNNPQTCVNPQGFVDDLTSMFRKMDSFGRGELAATEAINDVMDAVRKYNVSVSGDVTAVVVTTCVLEGWASQLDATMNIMDQLKTMCDKHPMQRIGESLETPIMLATSG
mmetsp:Transcript_48047/g.153990  ORF Transcript_48047/g.153990 Transcript_48047/m.153990 type:complete len:650 (+) Transcript_48047:195-2144(+)|eukprot:CAMPEP_0182898002 /NCGR_PEP_ID=MMETSP0034_2-20130328/27224_1 /TAXON_ID=156128 /ORGANISM="Nephroselmis pyriformis, Strain CCMP717" /LENGTH=649 /DNA_ID=CAMNT_0025031949 /DNA_START=182 /DNA_END=2131 /DNA_ORIENTATION=+